MPSVADLLIEGLAEAGARRLFCVPGGASVGALLRSAGSRGFPVVPVHSEVAACVMAAVSGELGDAPGAAAVGSVAGARPGLAHARLDRAPMILLTEPAPSAAALDPETPSGALAKQSLAVAADSASHWIAHAARLAMQEPRGPVHLALSGDVAERMAIPVAASARPPRPPAPEPAALDAAAALIAAASRPLIVAGLGCRAEDRGWLRAFAEALPAPVLTTLKAKGTMPEPHPLALGVLGGGAPEEPIVRRADLVIAVGLDAVELGAGPWPLAAEVLHLARAPRTGEAHPAAAEVVGEPGLILAELAPRLRGKAHADWDVAEVDRLKRVRAARLAVGGCGLTPHRVTQLARELTPAGTIAAIDGDAAMLAVALAWQAVAPGECLVPNALATAGFALPAAVAAQLVEPGRRVLCFTGTGGLRRALGELETVARLALPIVVIVLDAAGSAEPLAVARGFGIPAREATDAEAARQALVEMLDAGRPALIAVRVRA